MPEQVLCLPHLVAKCATRGELDLERLLGKGHDGGPVVLPRGRCRRRIEGERSRLNRGSRGMLRKLPDQRWNGRLRYKPRN